MDKTRRTYLRRLGKLSTELHAMLSVDRKVVHPHIHKLRNCLIYTNDAVRLCQRANDRIEHMVRLMERRAPVQRLEQAWQEMNYAVEDARYAADNIRGTVYSNTVCQSSPFRQRIETPFLNSPSDIANEIMRLEELFTSVQFSAKDKTIVCETDRIVLEYDNCEEDLGPMEITLRAVGTGECKFALRVSPLDPNWYRDNEDKQFHPHVSTDNHVCLGQGSAPYHKALKEGRIFDALEVINTILHTYNPESPYAPINEWHGRTCHSCGDLVSHEDVNYCNISGVPLCGDCCRTCDECSETVGPHRINHCSECDQYICTDCWDDHQNQHKEDRRLEREAEEEAEREEREREEEEERQRLEEESEEEDVESETTERQAVLF